MTSVTGTAKLFDSQFRRDVLLRLPDGGLEFRLQAFERRYLQSVRLSTTISPSACRRLRLRETNSRTVPICAASSLLFMGSVTVTGVSVARSVRLAETNQQRHQAVADRGKRKLFNDADQPSQASSHNLQHFQSNLRVLQTERLKILPAEEQEAAVGLRPVPMRDNFRRRTPEARQSSCRGRQWSRPARGHPPNS